MEAQDYTLVVVDMQSCWDAANDQATITAVEREIRKARAEGRAIVLMSVPYWSPMDEEGLPFPHKCLRELVEGYPLYRHVEKLMWQDGASNLINACQHWHLPMKHWRVCGVNTAGCVHALVKELRNLQPQTPITIVQDACNSTFGLELKDAEVVKTGERWEAEMWRYFEVLPNVELVQANHEQAA